jgi:hypothetical protein
MWLWLLLFVLLWAVAVAIIDAVFVLFFWCAALLQKCLLRFSFNFGVRQDGSQVSDVQLPQWANTASDFIRYHSIEQLYRRTQQHSNTTTQQHNNTATQQHNSTTQYTDSHAINGTLNQAHSAE